MKRFDSFVLHNAWVVSSNLTGGSKPQMVELGDTSDLSSDGYCSRVGSSPTLGTFNHTNNLKNVKGHV